MKNLAKLSFAFIVSLLIILQIELPVVARSEDRIRVQAKQLIKDAEFSSERIRVVYKDDLERTQKDKSIEARKGLYNVVQVKDVTGKKVEGDSMLAVSDASKQNVEDALYELLSDPNVAYAAPDYLYKAEAWTDNGTQAYPGDYDVTGPTYNHWYYDSGKVKEMWHDQGCPSGENCGGDPSVVIAVIDTGLAYESYDDRTGDGFTENVFSAVLTDLPNLFVNSGEIENDGLDNDCNGLIDDYHGVDTFAYTGIDAVDWSTYDYDGDGDPDDPYDLDNDGVLVNDAQNYPLSFRTCQDTDDDGYVETPIDFSGETNLFRRKPGHPIDTYGHGSFVTGLIAGGVDNGGGTVSPAFNVTILPISASINAVDSAHTFFPYSEDDYSYFWTSDIQMGIEYAGFMGADVVNMSLGGDDYDEGFQEQINYWHSHPDNPIVFVAASGNDSSPSVMQPISYPAAYDNVISVGAVNSDNTRSAYSNGGVNLDLVAYVGQSSALGSATYQQSLSCFGCSSEGNGGGVFSGISADVNYGTSFAAPQVAAAAGIILSNNPGMTAGEVHMALYSSSVDIGASGRDDSTGFGKIDYQLANDFTMSETDIENLTIYRYISGDRAWIWVGNPSDTENVYINVNIGGYEKGQYEIRPQQNLPLWYEDTFMGPVKITGSGSIHVSQKIKTVAGKLNESLAVSSSSFGTEFWYPVYRYVNGDAAWIWLANPSYADTAAVRVSLDGIERENLLIPPRQNAYVEFPGEFSGPVEISSAIPIYTTMKSKTGEGIEEFEGISPSNFASEFYYPVYRSVNGDGAWIWIGNPDQVLDVNISIEIAGQYMGTEVVPAGENIALEYKGVFDGPVKITADGLIFSTLKSRVGNVINEFSGVQATDFNNNYSFPIYRYIDADQSWIWISNPSEVDTANVTVSIGGVLRGTYEVGPGDVVPAYFPNTFAGPVRINSNIPIFSTLKSRVSGSLDEFAGIHD